MFELVERNRKASAHRFATIALSMLVHVVVVGALIIVPLLYVSSDLPKPNDIIAVFSAPAPAPVPPPPPPPPAAAPQPRSVGTTGQQNLAPVAPPNEITQAPDPPPPNPEQGVPGGVPGGIAGGVAGGVVGGIPEAPPGGAPVRVGGRIAAPDLTHRVEPKYPAIAQNSHVGGTVVLEATVDTSGRVQSVRVLRGVPLLNDSAVEAVRQWRYSPLRLNGTPTPFILTVTVTFQLQ